MPTFLTQPVEEVVGEAGPRLKKFTRDECDAIAESGVIDVKPLELIDGDILVKHAPLGPVRRRWTVDEVEGLRAAGAVDVDRLELIEGELYDKMGRSRRHVIVRHQVAVRLYEVFGIDHVVMESTVQVGGSDRVSNEPVPDIAVTEREVEAYRIAPQPEDVWLLVQVSDTTLRQDLETKAALFARSGVVEYWVADLNGHRLVVHRQAVEGRYASVVSYDVTESVTPLQAPGHTVAVRSLFPETV
jgi:Uma2 family endonuclease